MMVPPGMKAWIPIHMQNTKWQTSALSQTLLCAFPNEGNSSLPCSSCPSAWQISWRVAADVFLLEDVIPSPWPQHHGVRGPRVSSTTCRNAGWERAVLPAAPYREQKKGGKGSECDGKGPEATGKIRYLCKPRSWAALSGRLLSACNPVTSSTLNPAKSCNKFLWKKKKKMEVLFFPHVYFLR